MNSVTDALFINFRCHRTRSVSAKLSGVLFITGCGVYRSVASDVKISRINGWLVQVERRANRNDNNLLVVPYYIYVSFDILGLVTVYFQYVNFFIHTPGWNIQKHKTRLSCFSWSGSNIRLEKQQFYNIKVAKHNRP